MQNKGIRRVLFVIALAMIVIPGALLAGSFWQYAQADSEYAALAQNCTQPAAAPAAAGMDGEPEWQPLEIDWDTLQAQNPQVAAWIEVDALDGVSYPVVRGDDDAFYLNHSYLGAENSSGAIFMETLNNADFSDAYTILFGHNMKSGKMFGQLKKYASESFYGKDGGWITVYTPEHTWRYAIFSVETVAPTAQSVYTLGYQLDTPEYQEYIQAMQKHSLYDTGIQPQAAQPVLTLSTCSGHENRFVVHAVRMYEAQS